MKKSDLAKRLARQGRITKAKAADELDRVIHDILRNLRKGQPTSLPGLGTFTPGRKPRFRFEPPRGRPAGRKRRA